MEHASSLVNLASSQYVVREFSEAVDAYEQALSVFELVEDVDKVTKVLVNLANLAELQVGFFALQRAGVALGEGG